MLKAAWGSYGSVKMAELVEGTMVFDFESDADRDRVLDMSPWAVHDHCINLKLLLPNQSLDEVDFSTFQMWGQVHGLSGVMLNIENTKQIAESVGKGLSFENERDMQMRGYIRFKAELSVKDSASPGFWWANDQGEEKWVSLKYERLSDLCYGCGRLGHTSQVCNLDVTPSEVNNKLPMYGP